MSAAVRKDPQGVFEIVLPPRPYPGLRPFNKDEWPIFFGRERMADEVVRRLTEQQFLVVHGDSGCGKSSLIRAGVLPRLEQEAARGGAQWLTCVAAPGDEPLKNLARAIGEVTGETDDASVMALRRMLNCGSDGAALLVEHVRQRTTAHVCVLVDQFEELFAHARRRGRQEASVFIDLLRGLERLSAPGLCVVLTMRSEFLGACAQFEGFAETVNQTQYLLPRMAQADLVRAIREPASLYDGEVALDLAHKLIADAGGGQDELPLIQHGLMVLHRMHAVDKRDWRLTASHYGIEGGLAQLLSDHADQVADSVAPADEELPDGRIVEDLFRALTDINADGQAIRRPQKLSQLVAVAGGDEASVRRIIDAFRAEGVSFLRPYGADAIAPDEYVDISHEALIRYWRRIADPIDGWLIREFKNGLVWRSLLVQADSFDRNHSNVLSPATSEEREKWLKRRNAAWAERYGGGWDRVSRLIEASAAERERQKQEELEERRREEEARLRERELAEKTRRVRTLKRAVAVVLTLACVAIGLAIVAYQQSMKANVALEQMRSRSEEATTAWRLAETKRVEAERSALEIRQQLDQLLAAAAKADNSALQQQVQQAGSSIAQEVSRLEDLARVSPRVYIHIAEESQRAAARVLRSRIEGENLGEARIVVAGVELVKGAPPASQLRCFRPEDCKEEGQRLAKLINGELTAPQVTLEPTRTAQKVRQLHYELWFAPGPIELRGAAKRY